jgi:DNA-binding NtrC family response regulator
MTRFRILIVDDEPDITSSLKKGLEEEGFAIDSFNDAIKALAKFKPHVYILALIDVKMPRMNGFELYRELEKIDENLKVAFITGFFAYYESLKEIFPVEGNTDFFIKKPIEIDRLVKIIKTEIMKSIAD